MMTTMMVDMRPCRISWDGKLLWLGRLKSMDTWMQQFSETLPFVTVITYSISRIRVNSSPSQGPSMNYPGDCLGSLYERMCMYTNSKDTCVIINTYAAAWIPLHQRHSPIPNMLSKSSFNYSNLSIFKLHPALTIHTGITCVGSTAPTHEPPGFFTVHFNVI